MAGVDQAAAEALFAETIAPQVVEAATQSSVALRALPVVPMGTKTTRVPVLSALPVAGFLNADQAVKPQSAVAWANKLLTAEEVAVIIPVSEAAIADASIDIVASIVRLIGQEFGRVVDGAVFFGTGAPASWPVGGLFGAATSGQKIAATDVPATDMNALLGNLEAAGHDATDVFAGRTYKAALRGQTGVGGVPIYTPENGAGSFASIYGVPLGYPLGWDATKADAIAVDDSAVMIGLRQDVTIKMLTEATLTGFGNLAEKDSVAVRAVMRVAFAIADPVSVVSGARTTPVSVLTPKAGA